MSASLHFGGLLNGLNEPIYPIHDIRISLFQLVQAIVYKYVDNHASDNLNEDEDDVEGFAHRKSIFQ
jgi:hypothetical protein